MCQSLLSACLNMRPCSLVHAHSTNSSVSLLLPFLLLVPFVPCVLHSHSIPFIPLLIAFMCFLIPSLSFLTWFASDYGVCCLLWRACGCLDEWWLCVRWTMGSMPGSNSSFACAPNYQIRTHPTPFLHLCPFHCSCSLRCGRIPLLLLYLPAFCQCSCLCLLPSFQSTELFLAHL